MWVGSLVFIIGLVTIFIQNDRPLFRLIQSILFLITSNNYTCTKFHKMTRHFSACNPISYFLILNKNECICTVCLDLLGWIIGILCNQNVEQFQNKISPPCEGQVFFLIPFILMICRDILLWRIPWWSQYSFPRIRL